MPYVNGKKYSYDKKGKSQALKAAKSPAQRRFVAMMIKKKEKGGGKA